MTTVRQLLSAQEIRPQKRLGQSFLEDMNVTKRIAALVAPGADETVVEIGAGLGFMTEELARTACRVVALEIDPRLLSVLRKRFEGVENVEVVDCDVLKYDFSTADTGKKIKVVGNVPYYISSPILFRLLSYRNAATSFVLMFQKELAERITAAPGSKKYGIPSVMVAKYTNAACEMTVSPQCFYPVPDVASAVVRLTVKENLDDPLNDLFDKLVHAAFAHRRKNIFNNMLYMGFSKEVLGAVFAGSEIDPVRRAETLTLEEFTKLTLSFADTAMNENFRCLS
jgi:16S rRNA (adenine1518-N6/adenine1519-N6)-dimethyltransferase